MTQLATLPLPVVALASPIFPDPDTCWQAVQRRDRAYNGRFWFSVKSTGVYCLPSCAARPPLRRNVDFHSCPEVAEKAGFRPCKRCKPREWQTALGLSTAVAKACALFDAADSETPPSLAAVARKVGVSANTLSKRFIAELGVNPRDWLVARKRQRFRKALRDGEKVYGSINILWIKNAYSIEDFVALHLRDLHDAAEEIVAALREPARKRGSR